MLQPRDVEGLLGTMALMASVERLVAEFYRTCAETWKEDSPFWSALVKEEEKHAENIEQMIQIVRQKPERFEIGRPFNKMALQTIMKGLEGHLQDLKAGRLTRERVMILARDIESSLMEKSYGEIVKTNDLEYLELLKTIVKDTAMHKRTIEEKCLAMGGAQCPLR
ncbi:MAG TPA: hypothetical protein PK836_00885 [Syntrophales bacterium]|nr:hypothetical protein [Syntrophales bacterium]HOM06441.1 hypothetical protein [Syntrophales bacterium]HON99108.1 hypothetical protein [Syntrophales bacterium]HPC00216.1 hypothetical protein [Syntrophales bacterium]HPQ05879.1 hypothetical protein [Syntrophales bacterium]